MAIVMRIEYVEDEQFHVPVVICDHCGKRIEEARKGNVEWRVDRQGKIAEGGALSFTHKACCHDFENEHGGRSKWYSTELSVFPLYLGNGLGLDWGKARETARDLSLI